MLKIIGVTAVLMTLVVAPSAAAVKPAAGKWKGRTAQGLQIKFVVKSKGKRYKVARVKYKVRETCTGTLEGDPFTVVRTVGDSWPKPRDPDARQAYLARGARWTYAYYFSAGNPYFQQSIYAKLRGKFVKRKRAKGSLRHDVEDDVRDNPNTLVSEPNLHRHCNSGVVRWKAHRAR